MTLSVALIPRDKYSTAERVLKPLIEELPSATEVVVFDNGYPRPVRDALEVLAESGAAPARFVSMPRFANVNAVWNRFVASTSAETLVCLENDVIPRQGCIAGVVDALGRGLADVVVPVIYEEDGENLHFDPPRSEITECDGGLRSELVRRPKAGFESPKTDRPIAHLERHCFAMSAEAAQRLGPLDEEMYCRTDIDMSLACRAAGLSIGIAVNSEAVLQREIELSVDRDLFDFRWRLDRVADANARVIEKWSLVGYKTTINHAHRLRKWLDTPQARPGSPGL
jgi:GT2 family glycosyltransferase